MLTAAQVEILAALVGTMIPSDELGPGACDAQVTRYIDRALPQAEHRVAFLAGLEATDAHARATFGSGFAELGPDRSAAMLGEIERNGAAGFDGGSAAFFALLRTMVLEGMFGDPAYGGNAGYVGWKLIGYPGHMPEITPEEQQIDAEVVPIYERPGHR